MEPFIGMISLFGFNFAPRSWAFCNGQLIDISSNAALFSLLGNYYGGDGRTNFALPDLRGRLAMHAGDGPGLTPRRLGTKLGQESTTLGVSQMPSHSHTADFQGGNGSATVVKVSTDEGTLETPVAGAYLAAGTASGRPEAQIYRAGDQVDDTVDLGGVTGESGGGTVTVHDTGEGQPLNVVNPVQVVSFCIALQGIFPSRS
jgi:microcystin-dependent protein